MGAAEGAFRKEFFEDLTFRKVSTAKGRGEGGEEEDGGGVRAPICRTTRLECDSRLPKVKAHPTLILLSSVARKERLPRT